MKDSDQGILNMMDILVLPLAIDKYQELIVDSNHCNYSFPLLIRELLIHQYHDRVNRCYETNLRLSKLINKGASIEQFKSGNGRLYNDATVHQILSFSVVANRKTSVLTVLPLPENHIFYQFAAMRPADLIIAASSLIIMNCSMNLSH